VASGGDDVAGDTPAKQVDEMAFDEWYDAVQRLMADTDQGSREAKRDLAQLLEAPPEEVRSLNWDKSVRTHLVKHATRDTDPSRHMVPERIERMREQLRNAESSAVEDLLIERVLTCWTHMFAAEIRWVAKCEQGMTYQAGDYYQRALDRAHRRYVSALKALAEVRRLLGVTVNMVNVVQQQTVSIGGSGPLKTVEDREGEQPQARDPEHHVREFGASRRGVDSDAQEL
jgi:hypothetical protein